MSEFRVSVVMALHLPSERLLPLLKESLASIRSEAPAEIIGVTIGEHKPQWLAPLAFDHLLPSPGPALASAWNRGIALAFTLKSTHILIVHHDVLLRRGCLAALLELSARYREIAAWSPRLTNNLDALDSLPFDSRLDPFVSYSCALFKASTFECVGLFDESYSPRYYEVHDFHQRIQESKLKVLTTSRAHAFHLGAAVLKYLMLEGRQDQVAALEAAREANAQRFAEKWGKSPIGLEG